MRTGMLIMAIGLVTVTGCSAPVADSSAAASPAGGDHDHLAVVELFQSQGCSSCPPAIANVNAIANRPNVLALTFSVTYWDRLGWTDTFAKPAFTERQWDYARARGSAGVFTPQIVVDGRASIVGARRAQLEQALAETSATIARPSISQRAGDVEVAAGRTSRPASVWLVDFDPHARAVPIGAGENSGRTIVHRNVVTDLTLLGSWTGGAARFALPPARSGIRRAVLVQLDRAGPIISARKL